MDRADVEAENALAGVPAVLPIAVHVEIERSEMRRGHAVVIVGGGRCWNSDESDGNQKSSDDHDVRQALHCPTFPVGVPESGGAILPVPRAVFIARGAVPAGSHSEFIRSLPHDEFYLPKSEPVVPETSAAYTVRVFSGVTATLAPGEEKLEQLEYLWVRLVTNDWEYTERVK